MTKVAPQPTQVFTHHLFGAQVRAWRTSLNLTQRELANTIGVSNGFIAHVETGRTLPSVSTCKKLAHVLGVRELEMLTAAGLIAEGEEKSDDQYLEPEFRVFFRDVWPRMSEDERQLTKDMVAMMKGRVDSRTAHA